MSKEIPYVILGVDTSLTHTGYCVIFKGKVIESGVISSKHDGDTPQNELTRITRIVAEIAYIIDRNRVNHIVIEGLAFAARNSTALVQLSALNYMVRRLANDRRFFFTVVAPTSLKKFITGSGKGDKDMMMMSVYKNYGFEATDNNECDAYALAIVGLALLDKPLKKLTVPQQEVIKLLKKQL